ncbi:MAG: VapC toxin family PIN domain ribonuclease [Planctomycetes bacterium]|nr:VapC toxin family PIN domain ribonuclease [Planctomycetota bacterium]
MSCCNIGGKRQRIISVVDNASALLTLLHNERGVDVVERRLPGAALSAVIYSKVLKRAIERRATLSVADAFIREALIDIIAFEDQQGSDTVRFREIRKALGLSFADRSCLALGRAMNRPSLTADMR